MNLCLFSEDEQIRQQFYTLKSKRDVAELLNIDLQSLTYQMFSKLQYRTFHIPKSSGGTREIESPPDGLKNLQRRLNEVLQLVYLGRGPVHGFVQRRSIVSNAWEHSKSKWILNLDLNSFFQSINFGRVRGMFMAKPYHIGKDAATLLAQLCCWKGHLPQGAPTSPIVSNMVCAKLDSQLKRLASDAKCRYTRYADDITLSTKGDSFPRSLALRTPIGETTISHSLARIIEDNGFSINTSKVRLQRADEHQEVTGLTVNFLPNLRRIEIRNIRAMLHAWRKYGLESAQKVFDQKSKINHRNFAKVLRGKIEFVGMVRGKNDILYLSFLDQYSVLTQRPQLKSGVTSRWADAVLETAKRAIWVVDTPNSQGSAFALHGVDGLVTCAHVVDSNTSDKVEVHCPYADGQKYEATIVTFHKYLDLALLKTSAPLSTRLLPGSSLGLIDKDQVVVLGFPQYGGQGSLGMTHRGHFVGERVCLGSRRFHVSAKIIAGNSGGPVLNSKYQVIGIAVTGSDSFEEGPNHDFNGAIPIEDLKRLFK